MADEKKFSLLRGLLRTLGLSQEAADDVINWIVDLLSGDSGDDEHAAPELPYHMREHFLSPAELSFWGVLHTTTNGRAAICTKVGLGDLFQVKTDDQSQFRTYTNKIDRKHVDFLLCDVATMRPLVAIELDDKSHRRGDRQARDQFVDGVFSAAGLPLLHIPAKRAYAVAEIAASLAPYLENGNAATPAPPPSETEPQSASESDSAPTCPKCGGEMVLRTAKSGANAGNQFWGCSNYPKCRAVLPLEE